MSGETRTFRSSRSYSSVVGPFTVEPPNVGNTYTYSVAPMNAPGTYTIAVGRVDGSEAPAQVTVTVPEPPPPPSSATVISPTFGATVLAPWDGPIRVRWDVISNPAAWYRVSLNGEALCEFDAVDLTPGQVTSCDLPSNAPFGENGITLYEAPFAGTPVMIGSSVFYVEPHLAINSLGLSPATFYPYVSDGFRDRTRLVFHLNKEANLTAVVRTMRGVVVRRESIGFLSDGAWYWNGRRKQRYPRPPRPLPRDPRGSGIRRAAQGNTRGRDRPRLADKAWIAFLLRRLWSRQSRRDRQLLHQLRLVPGRRHLP